MCGSSSCPCIGFADAISVGYTISQNQTSKSNITIMAYPGNYVGTKNSNLPINYTLQIK